MTYVEIAVTITALSGLWNAILQTGWLKWSYGVHKRKHFTDSEAAGAEIDIIHSIQEYVDAKVENELVIKARDKEWSEFMDSASSTTSPSSLDKEMDVPEYVPFEDFEFNDPNSHLEKDDEGKYDHKDVKGALDGVFA